MEIQFDDVTAHYEEELTKLHRLAAKRLAVIRELERQLSSLQSLPEVAPDGDFALSDQ